jgi:hypothetical protein
MLQPFGVILYFAAGKAVGKKKVRIAQQDDTIVCTTFHYRAIGIRTVHHAGGNRFNLGNQRSWKSPGAANCRYMPYGRVKPAA